MKNLKNILAILILAFAISGLYNDSFKMFNSPLAVMGNIVDDNVIVVAATKTKSYETTAKLGTLPVVTKQCATFNGWWTAKDTGGTQVTADTLVSSLGSVRTLYARWTDSHTISYTKTATTHSGTCSTCSTTFTAVEHSWETTTAATCTTVGSKKCTVCGYTATIAVSSHTWETTTAATCTTAGSKKCSSCSTTQAIPALGHTGNPCSICGNTLQEVTVTFKAMYGTFLDGTSTKTVTATVGETYGDIPRASSSLPMFWVLGWSTIASGGVTLDDELIEFSTISNQVTSSTIVTNTSDHTLYAKWVCECCMRLFDKAGMSHSCLDVQCPECYRCESHCTCGSGSGSTGNSGSSCTHEWYTQEYTGYCGTCNTTVSGGERRYCGFCWAIDYERLGCGH